MGLLETIRTPADVKKLRVEQLNILAREIRERIVSVTYDHGGHLSSNLGTVDLIVALYYVFDFPEDKLVFDVGHQSYAHKILSGRNDRFDTIRQKGGLSGFPFPAESEYDVFCAGHAGNSVSACLGLCASRDALGEDYNVIDVVGDASLFNGENLEALTSGDKKPKKFIVIVNDNGMSISVNDNGLYKFFTRIASKKSYGRAMAFAERAIGQKWIGRQLKKMKRSFKIRLNKTAVIDSVGLKYVGIFDGHDIRSLVRLLTDLKDSNSAILLHLKTTKGKGMAEAEKNAGYYHGVGCRFRSSENTFSAEAGRLLCAAAEKDEKLAVICAGMKDGTGLSAFAEKFPDRFYDVGIAEEHAVTFAAGMSKGGLHPVVCIYSTFLQRSFDQIMHDVCLPGLPVIFFVDRAGAVGADGATHQGLFDLSYLTCIPGLKVFAPVDREDMALVFDYARTLGVPCAIRYPNGTFGESVPHDPFSVRLWDGDDVTGKDNVILAVGARMFRLAKKVAEETGKSVAVVNARLVSDLDEELLNAIGEKNIVTMEENVEKGGFGSAVALRYAKEGRRVRLKIFAFPEKFVFHGTVNEQLAEAGFTEENIAGSLV